MLDVAMEELKRVMRDFYNITGIKTVLYDSKRKMLYSYPEEMCGFCKIVRSNNVLAQKCLNCDSIGFDECDKLRRPYIYKCHMGLSEAVAPIIENGVVIGYMMMGQILNMELSEKILKKVKKTAEKYGIDSEKLLKEVYDFKAADDNFIMSAANMLSMCACYLYFNKIIKNRTDMLVFRIKDYIDAHISEEISVADICRNLYISKSRLYSVSKSSFGMGISDYIRKFRLERAKNMLLETEKNICQIAYESGFKDPNYFTRTFKKYEGITPGAYRKIAAL